MPWVLMTPLGSPVEPEVNRNLAMVSAPIEATACSSAGPGRLAVIASNAGDARRYWRRCGWRRSRLRVRSSAASALANGAGVGDVDQAGLEQGRRCA